MYVLNIIEKLNKFMEPVDNWITEHYRNPFLWIGLFFGGLLVFFLTYDALKKEK